MHTAWLAAWPAAWCLHDPRLKSYDADAVMRMHGEENRLARAQRSPKRIRSRAGDSDMAEAETCARTAIHCTAAAWHDFFRLCGVLLLASFL